MIVDGHALPPPEERSGEVENLAAEHRALRSAPARRRCPPSGTGRDRDGRACRGQVHRVASSRVAATVEINEVRAG
jgi:hypothetical protein